MKDRYLTVTALTRYLKKKLELDPHLENVWLRGEISNFKLHLHPQEKIPVTGQNSIVHQHNLE